MLRKAKGLTQTALATSVGLKPTIISRMENDDVEPSMGSAERIAKELGTTIDWLRCMPGTTIDKWWPGSGNSPENHHTAPLSKPASQHEKSATSITTTKTTINYISLLSSGLVDYVKITH